MNNRENSKLQQQMQPFGFGEQEQHSSPYFSYPSSSFSLYTLNHHTNFSKFCPMFSNMEFSELKNNARPEADTGNSNSNSNSLTPSDDSYHGSFDIPGEHHSYAKSDTDSCSGGDDASDEEASLDELLLNEKAKKKIEQLAAMVGVNTTEPLVVLTEVVKVLKVLKRIN